MASSTTSSPAESSDSGGSFLDDPHNMATYVVLPVMFFVYGGCCVIYCIARLHRYCKRKARQRQLENSQNSNDADSGLRTARKKIWKKRNNNNNNNNNNTEVPESSTHNNNNTDNLFTIDLTMSDPIPCVAPETTRIQDTEEVNRNVFRIINDHPQNNRNTSTFKVLQRASESNPQHAFSFRGGRRSTDIGSSGVGGAISRSQAVSRLEERNKRPRRKKRVWKTFARTPARKSETVKMVTLVSPETPPPPSVDAGSSRASSGVGIIGSAVSRSSGMSSEGGGSRSPASSSWEAGDGPETPSRASDRVDQPCRTPAPTPDISRSHSLCHEDQDLTGEGPASEKRAEYTRNMQKEMENLDEQLKVAFKLITRPSLKSTAEAEPQPGATSQTQTSGDLQTEIKTRRPSGSQRAAKPTHIRVKPAPKRLEPKPWK